MSSEGKNSKILFWVKRSFRTLITRPIVLVVTIVTLGLAVAATAGSLTPSASVAATMNTLAEVYNSIASTFDSSGISASQNGSLIQHLKYIEANMGSSGSGGIASIAVRESDSSFVHVTSLSFETGHFNISNTASLSVIKLDWTNGPASRSAAQTISGLWTFSGGATISAPFEVSGYASLSNGLFATGGNLGIGTTSPTARIAIDKGATSDAAIVIDGDAATVRDLIYRTDGSNRWIFRVNQTAESGSDVGSDLQIMSRTDAGAIKSTPFFIQRSTGYVGISNQAPTANLDVTGTASISSNFAINANKFYVNGSTGNVGIGTKNVTTNGLELVGTASISEASAATTPVLKIIDRSVAGTDLGFHYENFSGGGDVVFNNNGNIGIGNNAPVSKLHISDSASVTDPITNGTLSGILLVNTNTSGAVANGIEFAQSDAQLRNAAIYSLKDNASNQAAGLLFGTHTGSSFTEKLRITSGGNIGIGTTSPGATLDVTGTASISSNFAINSNKFYVHGSNGNVGIGTKNFNSNVLFEVAGTASISNSLYVTNAGNLGIGTTSPDAKLHVIASTSAVPFVFANGRTGEVDELVLEGTGAGSFSRLSFDYDGHSAGGDGHIEFRHNGTAASRQLIFDIGGTDVMTLKNGNVGIGTGTADALTGAKQANVLSNSSTSQLENASAGLLLANTNTTNNNWIDIIFSDDVVGTSAAVIGTKITDHTNNYGELHFTTRGASGIATRMMVDSTGNIGIGTSAPGAKLHVSGNASISTNFEASGYASSSTYFGGGLSDCDNENQSIRWTASGSNAGKFSCTVDNVESTIIFGAPTLVANRPGLASGSGGFEYGVMRFTSATGVNVASTSNQFAITMNASGHIRAIKGQHSAALTAGVAEVMIQKNGVLIDMEYARAQSGDTSRWGGQSFLDPTEITFVAGDRIGIIASTNAALAGGPAATVYLTFSLDSSADLAEVYYAKDGPIGWGSLVESDKSLFAGVKESEGRPYSSKVMGVVSQAPGLLLGSQEGPGSPVHVALSGRTPVRVSTENGPIKPGDWLTTSSKPGVAMKATKAGTVIGQALEAYDNSEEEGMVMLFIKNSQYSGSWYESLKDIAGVASVSEQFSGKDIINRIGNQIAQNNLLSLATSSELFADRIVASTDVVAPKIQARDLVVDTISPLSSAGFTVVLLDAGSFSIKASQSGEDVVRFNSNGDAFIKGKLTVGSIELASASQDHKPSIVEGIFATIIQKLGDLFRIVFSPGMVQTETIKADTLCAGEICITEGQLRDILQRSRVAGTSAPTPEPTPELTPEITPIPEVGNTPEPSETPTPSETPEISSPPTPESPPPTPEPTPEPTQIATPEPSLESTPQPEPTP